MDSFEIAVIIAIILVVLITLRFSREDPKVASLDDIDELTRIKLKREVRDLQWFRRPYFTNPIAILIVATLTYLISEERLTDLLRKSNAEVVDRDKKIDSLNIDYQELQNDKGKLDSTVTVLQDSVFKYEEELATSLQKLNELSIEIENREAQLASVNKKAKLIERDLNKNRLLLKGEYTLTALIELVNDLYKSAKYLADQGTEQVDFNIDHRFNDGEGDPREIFFQFHDELKLVYPTDYYLRISADTVNTILKRNMNDWSKNKLNMGNIRRLQITANDLLRELRYETKLYFDPY